MSALAQLQRDLQHHVLSGDAAIAAAVNGTPAVPAATRLAVYSERLSHPAGRGARSQHASSARAARRRGIRRRRASLHRRASVAVRLDPLVRRSPRARARALACLSSRGSRSWPAGNGPWPLRSTPRMRPRSASNPWRSVAPGDWAELRLEFHPSVQCLELQTNAQALFKALSETTTGAATRGPRATTALAPLAAGPQDAVPFAGAGRNRRARGHAQRRQLRRDVRGLCEWHEADAVPLVAAGMLKRWIVEEL